jgi:hypothetical protein
MRYSATLNLILLRDFQSNLVIDGISFASYDGIAFATLEAHAVYLVSLFVEGSL